jgi:hypothetical protein
MTLIPLAVIIEEQKSLIAFKDITRTPQQVME